MAANQIHSTSHPSPASAPYGPPRLRVYGTVVELTRGAGGTLADMSNMTKNNPSDRAVKENIVKIGEHPLGFGLFLFDYREEYKSEWGRDRQFGVMADEIEAFIPSAVSMGSAGYKLVDYSKLGIIRPS